MPKFSDWLKMSDKEREKHQHTWAVYKGEGGDVVEEVVKNFKNEYGDISKLEIIGKGVEQGGIWVIAAEHPFVFDKRKIPEKYLGIYVKTMISGKLPDEFQVKFFRREYIWAPERYEKYVDSHMDEIRNQLDEPNMSRHEILSALCGVDFDEWVNQCKEWKRKGDIP